MSELAKASERPAFGTRRFVKASALLLGGQGLGQFSAVGRNAIVARLISVADMGIGRSFGLTATLLEMATYLAPESLMIQAKDGDSPRLQQVAHTIQALRGFIIGLLVFAVAQPITMLFEIPHALWAFQLLGIVPVIEGFMHLDPKRVQRRFDYSPAVIVESSPQFVMLLLAWPLAYWLRDYSVVLWLLLIKAMVRVSASHLLATRPYRMAWDGEYLARFLSFGWPLLVNGLLICVIRQGDHIILGASYGMAALGVYANAYMLTLLPAMMFANVSRSLVLPLLSSVQDDDSLYEKGYRTAVQIVSLLSLGLGVPFVIMGGSLVSLVFGDRYAEASSYVGWLAALAALRLFRAAPTQAAMARADTRNSMIANLFCSLGLAGMAYAAFHDAPIVWIAFFAFMGEVLAVAATLTRLKIRQGVSLLVSIRALSIPALALLSAAAVVELGLTSGWIRSIAATAAITLVSAAAGIAAFGLLPEILKAIGRGRFSDETAASSTIGGDGR